MKADDVKADLSIIIVNWNTRELLAGCLESVAGSRLKVEGRGAEPVTSNLQPSTVEVIVVDNASSDGSAAMVRERFPWARLIENAENVGFAAANNQGIRQAAGRFVVLLNSDTEVREGALDALVHFMDAHPRAGAVGARLLNADGTLQPSCHPMLTPGREFWRLMFLDRLLPRATYPMQRWKITQPRRVEVIMGACLLLRREALDQVGPLDDSYFMYTEEVDLCYRLAQAGWELWWEPRAEVVHYGGASSRQMREEMYLQLYRSKAQFYRKFGGEKRVATFKRYLRLAYLPRRAAVQLAGAFSPAVRRRGRIYHRMLEEMAEW